MPSAPDGSEDDAFPMFPLGSVLFPTQYVPLHVFEPRYRALVQHCLADEPEFGVVLIERGWEVGGGDVRTAVGCVARILEATELADGRWALGAVGTRRIRVVRWLDDLPYPRAVVAPWPDEDAPDTMMRDEDVAETVALLRRVLAQRAELGDPSAPATIELSDDPALVSYQIGAVGPFGPADRQALLASAGVASRLALAARLLREEEDVLRLRLAGG